MGERRARRRRLASTDAARREQVGEISEHYGLDIDPDAARRRPPRRHAPAGRDHQVPPPRPAILIFDEPTSVLTPAESEQLFDDASRDVVADEGKAVALVSHKLAEILHGDRRGHDHAPGPGRRPAGRRPTPTPASLARAMVGREVSLRGERAALGVARRAGASADRRARSPTRPPTPDAAPVLRSSTRHGRDRDGRVAARRARPRRSRAGEIVGVAGVEGNGQRELGDVLSSLHRRRRRRGRRSTASACATGQAGRDGGGRRRGDPRGPPRLRLRARLDGRREPAHRPTRPRRPAGFIDHGAMRRARRAS